MDEYIENWPKQISRDENPKYLDRIKLEYIQKAEFERNDPYYDQTASLWHLSLDLNIKGQKSHVFITYDDFELQKKIEKELRASNEFDIDDGRPKQYGKFTFTRRKK